MFISNLKLWNFRKFGKQEWNLENPHLCIPFEKGLNVLIGENDSGKSAIVDAIKLVLKTHAYEWIRVKEDDFFNGSDKLRIEIILEDLSVAEAKNFTEWLGWTGEGEEASPVLRLIYQVEKNDERIFPADVRAGMDDFGYPLNAEAKEYLKSTYLKALRDADSELVAKRNSRVSQILQGHELFMNQGEEHDFEKWFGDVNKKIKDWFDEKEEGTDISSNPIKEVIDEFLHNFIDDTFNASLTLTDPNIKSILEKITLGIDGAKNLGLGTMNRLYMAVELLHLRKDTNGLKLCLIEELEAHLHPQAQMKIVESLLKEDDIQFILTTHSPNLASKVDLNKIIICEGDETYPLTEDKTKLERENYSFLKRFLDVTKSNLFFAKGVIIVEGWTEEILIPAIAKSIGYDLTKHEVSIVNVGSTAYLHFAKIFLREDGKQMNTPVSIVTDLDIRPDMDGNFEANKVSEKEEKIEELKTDLNDSPVRINLAKEWTLEWCLFKSSTLSNKFKESVSEIHSGTEEFKKNSNDEFRPDFQKKLIVNLKKRYLDKVRIATLLADKIESSESIIDYTGDEYMKYLIDAIKYACNR